MPAHKDLQHLLTHANPQLDPAVYVFATFKGANYADLAWMKPIASIQEPEGLTLVIEHSVAEFAGIPADAVFSRISLQVHSALDAVGLTAAISTRLAGLGISANILAGFYHDHIFVPRAREIDALHALQTLS